MPRTREQNKLIKQTKEEKILSSSLGCFLKFTYNEVTIDIICDKAKISHGLFYHYFINKEDVYLSLLKKKINPLIKKEFSNIDLTHQKAKYSLLDLLDKTIEIIKRDDNDFYPFYLYLNMDVEKESLPKEAFKTTTSFYNTLIKLIKRSEAEGDIKTKDNKSIAYSICFFLISLCLNRYHLKNKKYLDVDMRSIVEIFLK